MTILKYHEAAFRNLGIEPEIDPIASEALRCREETLQLQFPPSVRELYQLKAAEVLLRGFEDVVVPIDQLGKRFDPSCPIVYFLADCSGNWSAYIYLDGKDDPTVKILSDENGWKVDDNEMPIEDLGCFSSVVFKQTEFAIEGQEWQQRFDA